MQKIATLAGLSRATVSDVINNRWQEKGITQKTHDKVLQVIRKYNYRPNTLARSLAAGKTHTIGVQLPSSKWEHWAGIHAYLDRAFRRKGYHMAMASASWFHHHEEEEIRWLCDRQVDGLILSPERGSSLHPLFQWITDRGIPFVFVGDAPLPGHYSVVDDNISQSRMAIEHFIKLGHTRIGYLHSSSRTSGERERRRGYLQTLLDHGLPVRKEYLGFGTYDFDVARQSMRRLMEQKHPPTAVYCAADVIALGAIDMAIAMGLRIPDDVAIIGHADDIPFIEQHRVPLTTVRQPRQELSERSAGMLLDLIEGRTPADTYVRLPGELVIRNSCGARKQS